MNRFEIDKQPLSVRTLQIGRGAGCALRLRDPVAAEQHCRIDSTADGFVLHDLDSPTGTFCNGRRVPNGKPVPLANGDVITVGSTRITATIREPGPICALAAKERSFQFRRAVYKKDATNKGVWVPGDRERWRESEVAFGAFPLLWNVVWGAILVAILAVAATAVPQGRAVLMQPGSLDSAHQGIDCGACHVTFGSPTASKCLACHEEMADRHPVPAPGSTGSTPFDCASCHREHQGTARTKTMQPIAGHGFSAPVLHRDLRFVPAADSIGTTCATCHGEKVPQPDTTVTGKSTGPSIVEAIPFDGFDHQQHLARKIECHRCHQPNAQRTSDPAERDFARFDYNGCMSCHGERAVVAPRTGLAFDAELDAPKLRSPDAWHGYRKDPSHCQTCHQDDPQHHDGKLREPIERRRFTDALAFELPGRPHDAEYAAHAGKDLGDCRRCHVAAAPRASARQQPFDHRTHCTALAIGAAAATSGDDAERLVPECRQCHTEIERSMALASPYLGPHAGGQDAAAACASCHGTAPIERRAADAALVSVRQSDFPHALHLSRNHPQLANGCLSCHEFANAAATAGPVAAMTRPQAKDCKSCHDRTHAAIGNGACRKCHGELDPAYRSTPADATWPYRRSRTRFSHFSDGHVQQMSEACTSCHDTIAEATSIATIANPPTEHDRQCQQCHLERRFHRPR